MIQETDRDKLARFSHALQQFIERLSQDRNVLGLVLVGGLDEETIWDRESLSVWIIETDGVGLRLRSDGNEERIRRILVEESVNIHAEIIPRSRFKQMVEGASRTAFSCNFFSHRKLVYCIDASIAQWFDQANTVATKDQERELLCFTTWTIYAVRHAKKLLAREHDLDLATQQVLHAAHSLAYTEIIRDGQVWEQEPIYKARQLNPELFQTIYFDVIHDGRNREKLQLAIERIDAYLSENYPKHLKPLLTYLAKADGTVALSMLSDQFAFSQIYPWHLESACEWLEQKGLLQKISAPFKLTKRSQESVEEPAYFLES